MCHALVHRALYFSAAATLFLGRGCLKDPRAYFPQMTLPYRGWGKIWRGDHHIFTPQTLGVIWVDTRHVPMPKGYSALPLQHVRTMVYGASAATGWILIFWLRLAHTGYSCDVLSVTSQRALFAVICLDDPLLCFMCPILPKLGNLLFYFFYYLISKSFAQAKGRPGFDWFLSLRRKVFTIWYREEPKIYRPAKRGQLVEGSPFFPTKFWGSPHACICKDSNTTSADAFPAENKTPPTPTASPSTTATAFPLPKHPEVLQECRTRSVKTHYLCENAGLFHAVASAWGAAHGGRTAEEGFAAATALGDKRPQHDEGDEEECQWDPTSGGFRAEVEMEHNEQREALGRKLHTLQQQLESAQNGLRAHTSDVLSGRNYAGTMSKKVLKISEETDRHWQAHMLGTPAVPRGQNYDPTDCVLQTQILREETERARAAHSATPETRIYSGSDFKMISRASSQLLNERIIFDYHFCREERPKVGDERQKVTRYSFGIICLLVLHCGASR
ncbi:hypothetical protein B0H17DRAFT_1133302 [Mycena rosella]|uniref:Uncharacterized protein n=1 Tax=Mycena rosella TaxID=1033263 RepID=A0AAD7DKG7_MYCRO|nr:hypothetical protein B0H17DRAFT_1133302 [Mycena rosella]